MLHSFIQFGKLEGGDTEDPGRTDICYRIQRDNKNRILNVSQKRKYRPQKKSKIVLKIYILG